MSSAAHDDLLPRLTGWWGKLPTRGDFVGRGLPRIGQQTWDAWLQRSLAAAAQQLGATALRQRLLCMPLWHFVVLAPSRRGELWCGAVAASRDRVGRAFPLLLAEAYAPEVLLPADVSSLRARARRLVQLTGDALEPPSPRELETRLATLAATPLDRTVPEGEAQRCNLDELRSKWPSAASFWWCVEPASDPRYPYAEPWPPQEELLFDLLAVTDQAA